MLLAEIHGKRCPEVRGNEDWLTSAVFGHLRHVSPNVFWGRLFGHAVTVDGTSLSSELIHHGLDIESFERVQMNFWQTFGSDEPDVIILFEKNGLPSLRILVEAKLNSGKSGDEDQLYRYLTLQKNSHPKFGALVPFRPVIYLTANSGLNDVRESLRHSEKDGGNDKLRLFSLQWQDIFDVAKQETSTMHPPILKELARFLDVYNLVHYRGMRPSEITTDGRFYVRGSVK